MPLQSKKKKKCVFYIPIFIPPCIFINIYYLSASKDKQHSEWNMKILLSTPAFSPVFFFSQSEAYTDDNLLNAQDVTSARWAVLIKTMKTKDLLWWCRKRACDLTWLGGEMFTDEVMSKDLFTWCVVTFADFFPHSLPEDIARGDQIKRSVTLNTLQDFSGFEHCWQHLG